MASPTALHRGCQGPAHGWASLWVGITVGEPLGCPAVVVLLGISPEL